MSEIATRRALLVGELNPYSDDPRFDLYPIPRGTTGDLLRRNILGVEQRDYLRWYWRENLCRGHSGQRGRRWSLPQARGRAADLKRLHDGQPIVLLGRRVADAWGATFGLPFRRHDNVIAIPHPSGRNRAWSDPEIVLAVQRALREMGVVP